MYRAGFGRVLVALWLLVSYSRSDLLHAEPMATCTEKVKASIRVDQGHAWLPPFGVDRIGTPAIAHVELAELSPEALSYKLSSYVGEREIERRPLIFLQNQPQSPFPPKAPSSYFAHVRITAIPSELALIVECRSAQREILRKKVSWPELEADATARADRLINPVDLGAILIPHNELLLARGQSAIVSVAAISHTRDLPHARLRASFESGRPVDIAWPIAANSRKMGELRVPLDSRSNGAALHISLTDGREVVWKKQIDTMIVVQPPHVPTFGAIETNLRYDAKLAAIDPRTGSALPAVDYRKAWDPKFKDVVVFLPNGSRFVLWRGANYIPLWHGRHSTGVLYQWAEDCGPRWFVHHPDGTFDCPEPLFDSELRYSRVRIVESTTSRVHIRWEYRLTDVLYETLAGVAAEDFYFYPDGFGTRVMTVPASPGSSYQLSEFIVVTPQAAYPFEVMPSHPIEALPLTRAKERIELPFPAARFQVEKGLPNMIEPAGEPVMYRIRSHREDTASAIYFHPRNLAVPSVFRPFYDEGQVVTPAYWGNHWPLNRGKWTGWAINDQVRTSPGHNSLGGFNPPRDPMTGKWLSDKWEVEPLSTSRVILPDMSGRASAINLVRFAWLIGYTDSSDEELRHWGQSFSSPPGVEVSGARLSLPSYSEERRAIGLIAEQSTIDIRLMPAQQTVNPVFEIESAPKKLQSVKIDDKALRLEEYAWDGTVLWTKATIGTEGATIRLRFR